MKSHFNNEDWLDFVRDVMPAPQCAALEQHLQAGCEQCTKSQTFWDKVQAAAHGAVRDAPPNEVVQSGIAIFADWRRRVVLPRDAKRARPIFDTLWEPLPVGVRGALAPPRRVVHRMGEWLIDLSIEWQPRDRVSLAGQALRPGRQPEAGCKVLVMRGDEVVAETAANQFGEFQFDFHQAPGLTVLIDRAREVPIAMALPDPYEPLPRKNSVKKRPGRPA